MTFREAMEIASDPRSRFRFGSPCRFIARCDFTCHLFIPELLRSGDTTQLSRWDQCRVYLSFRLNQTSPRWQWLANEWNFA